MRTNRSLSRSPSARAQRGMTLIEIIIVIVLIGGILAVVGPRVFGASERGKAKLAKIQVDTIGNKVSDYQTDTGLLPDSLDDLVSNAGNVPGWLGPYVKAGDLKDQWGNPIEYHKPGEAGPFDLISLGADGKVGGDSTDADIKFE